jgi:hypothetical protein
MQKASGTTTTKQTLFKWFWQKDMKDMMVRILGAPG